MERSTREIENMLEIQAQTGLQWPKRGGDGEEGAAGVESLYGASKHSQRRLGFFKKTIYNFDLFQKEG